MLSSNDRCSKMTSVNLWLEPSLMMEMNKFIRQ
jgi:hypothetical protein